MEPSVAPTADREYPSLAHIQKLKAQGLMARARELETVLLAFARAHKGRYVLYGSLARGDAHRASDVDLLADFPPACEAAAFAHAEDSCRRLGLKLDLRRYGQCSDKFLAAIAADARDIGP